MKILSLELTGSKRLLHKGTTYLKYDPNSSLQVLLGSNGYGKSTVFNELSPLPASRREYIKGGSKKIIIEDNGSTFELTSSFERGNHHSFLKDGKELNDGHTTPVQKQLVEQYFKYTPEVHEIIQGRVDFAKSTRAQRTQLMVKLAPNDVTYAMRVHKELLSQARNVSGARKLNAQKITEASKVLLDDDELASIEVRMGKLTQLIHELYGRRVNNIHGDNDALMAQCCNAFQKLKLELDRAKSLNVGLSQDSVDWATETSELNSEMVLRKGRIDQYLDEVERIQGYLADMTDCRDMSMEDLQSRVNELSNSLNALTQNPDVLEFKNVNADRIAKILVNHSAMIVEIMSTLPADPDERLTSIEYITDLEHRVDETKQKHWTIEKKIIRCEQELERMASSPEAECPQCMHKFQLEMDEKKKEKIHEYLEVQQKLLLGFTDAIAVLEGQLKEYRDYNVKLNEVRQLASSTATAEKFWYDAYQKKMLYTNPHALTDVSRYVELYNTINKVNELEAELDHYKTVLAKRQSGEGITVEKFESRLNELDNLIGATRGELNALEQQYNDARKRASVQSSLRGKFDHAMTLGDKLHRAVINMMQDAANAAIDSEIVRHQSTLATLKTKFDDNKTHIEILRSMNAHLEELELQAKTYSTLIDAISPATGLIASVMLGFINAFVDQFTSIIQNIWTTPLSIKPCGLDNGGELDYIFPLRGTSDDTSSGDISESSEGERELINFVFMMLARLYLGYTDYPLFMDEIGRTFSEAHRQRLYGYIKKLIESGLLNQVFVISHFPSTHAAMTNADFNMIDPTGVLVTPEMNKYLKVK